MMGVWCFAVGCAYLPLRHRQSAAYFVPGPLVALAFVLLEPGLVWAFTFLFVVTSIVMGLSTLLISPNPKVTLRRGAASLVGALVMLALLPIVPQNLNWVTIPMTPIVFLALPIGVLLLVESSLKTKTWYAPLCSIVMFTASWGVWMARDHYYRLQR